MKIGTLDVDATGSQWAGVQCPYCGAMGHDPIAANAVAIDCPSCYRRSPFKAPAIDLGAPVDESRKF